MKFVPRQPQPPRAPSRGLTTTRFLRLQPADDVAEAPARVEPRPLPAFPEPAPRENRTASQRVRLRLDPTVASQPLPNARQLVREPLSHTTAPAPGEPLVEENGLLFVDGPPAFQAIAEEPSEPAAIAYDPAVYSFSETERVPEATAEESLFDPPTEAPDEAALAEAAQQPFAEFEAEPEAQVFEIPAAAGTVEQVWVPPGPGHASASTWLPPVQRRPAPDVPARAEVAAEPEPGAAPEKPVETDSRRLPRPGLRRPVTPLAEFTRQEQGSLGRGFWILLVLLVALLLAALYFFAVAPRVAAYQARIRASQVVPARPVMFVVARQDRPATELPVTGTVEASRETPLYARTTGYVKSWLVDLGDKVQGGQVLAELDTPEVDHQLTQARASADQAKALVELAQNEADRWTAMVKDHAVSQQDANAKIAALNGAQANFNAAEANVGRLADLEMFKEIRAPYAGTITARNLEVGTLVGAGPGPAGSELFHLIETDPVRVFVNVPEANAPNIRGGLAAKLQVAAYPGRIFSGEVVRDAGALDPQSHELRTEIHVANPDGALMPGTLAEVHLLLFDNRPALLIPSNALVMGADGAAVVRIMPGAGREVARITAVKLGRSFGSVVEVLSNLRDGDRLVAHPPPDLKDGMIVDARPLENDPMPSLMPPHPSSPRA